MDHYPGFAIRR